MTIVRTGYGAPRSGSGPFRVRAQSHSNPILRRLLGRFLIIDVFLLFSVSGGMLWIAGLNYNGIFGSMADKIHPATYLASMCILLLLFTRSNPFLVLTSIASQQPGAMTLLTAFIGLMAFVVIGGRPGPAGLVDTFFLPVAVAIFASPATERDKESVEIVLHLILTLNAVLTLLEFVFQIEFFPFRFDGQALVESRPYALQGHPLDNAIITGLYATILLNGGGQSLPKFLLVPLVLLQLGALVASGGRTAIAFIIPVVGLFLLRQFVGILLGGFVSRYTFVGIFLGPAIGALVIFVLGGAGFFDVLTQRFSDDGGSAETRVQMLDLLAQIPLRELLLAPDVETIDGMRRAMGLELGIENPIIHFILYQGVFATIALLIAMTFFLCEIIRPLRGKVTVPLLYFLFVINSFESLGSKSTLLAKFVILMIVMFRPHGRGYWEESRIVS